MKKEDEEKTSFITPFGVFFFVRMPEGLKNASPTFCRMTSEAFARPIGRNLATYVDENIVTTKKK